jgi:UDP-glucose 4-epimerase
MEGLANKKILITGASGFLGTYLAESCYQEGGAIFGIDIRKPFNENIWTGFSEQGLVSDTSESMLVENNFDIIFHLAGGASVGLSVQDPAVDFNNLLPPTLTFITWIKKFCPAAHFILFSSAAVYGNPDSLPVKETAVAHPVSPYGIHKLLAEDMLFHYSKYYGFRASVLRIFSAFGEGLHKQIFWDVMTRYRNAVASSDGSKVKIELFGTGNESRDFIHGRDVARAAVLIAVCESNGNQFNTFNVAAGNEIKIKEAISYLFEHADPVPEISFNGVSRAGDPERWLADISKLKSIGFESSCDIKQSLGYFYKWCIAQ